MLTNYIIVEKLAGQYGRSEIRVVQGTEMMIVKGLLQIWNSEREGAVARRPVHSVPVERVISFKQQVNKVADDVGGTKFSATSPLRSMVPGQQSQVA